MTEMRYELDEVTEEELLQTVSNYFIASNNFKWQAIDMLCQAKIDWGWDRDEWADVKRKVAIQIERSEKTLSNWLTTGFNWPPRRREDLNIEGLSVSVLAELNGIADEERANSLAVQAAEQCWTVDQVRAEISGQRQEEKPPSIEFYGGDGSRQWTIQLSNNPHDDAEVFVDTLPSQYLAELITEIGFQLNEKVN